MGPFGQPVRQQMFCGAVVCQLIPSLGHVKNLKDHSTTMALTRSSLDNSRGFSTIFLADSFQSLACFLNPAPGNHSGRNLTTLCPSQLYHQRKGSSRTDWYHVYQELPWCHRGYHRFMSMFSRFDHSISSFLDVYSIRGIQGLTSNYPRTE